MKWVITAILIALILTAAVFIAGYFMYRFAIVRNKKQINFWEHDLTNNGKLDEAYFGRVKEGEKFIRSLPYEKVQITSHDGLKLCGRLFEQENARGTFIMVHGYRSHGLWDFSCAAREIFGRGFNMLIVDQRSHGYSEGSHIGFGEFERFDVVGWAKYVEKRFPALPIVMDGVSMGAATVMMGCSAGYPEAVKAINADCGYTTPGAICRETLKNWFKLPPFPLYYASKIWNLLLAHYDLDKTSSRASMEMLSNYSHRINVLIAHGKADGFVPYRMSMENIHAFDNDPTQFELFSVENADHGMSYLKDTKGYSEAIDRLLAKAGIQ